MYAPVAEDFCKNEEDVGDIKLAMTVLSQGYVTITLNEREGKNTTM